MPLYFVSCLKADAVFEIACSQMTAFIGDLIYNEKLSKKYNIVGLAMAKLTLSGNEGSISGMSSG